MDVSSSTASLLDSLDTLSGRTLTRREDLGHIIDIAVRQNRREMLEELSFLAKFLSRSLDIMKRIGKDGAGYDVLARESAGQMEKALALAQSLLESAPQEMRERFLEAYFTPTQDAMGRFKELLHDLGWYKNWLLDHRGKTSRGIS